MQLLAAKVYHTVNIITNQSYAVKLELSVEGESSVESEYHILKELISLTGIPRTHWFGRESNYDALVVDLLGPSLHRLLQQRKKFHVCTVAYLANQLVCFLLVCISP